MSETKPKPPKAPRRPPNVWAADVWNAWTTFWDRREDVAPLAVCRILLALVLLYDWWQVYHFDLVTVLYSPAPDGYAVAYQGWAAKLFGKGPELGHIVYMGAVISTICLGVGFMTRVACLAVIMCASQLAQFAPEGDRGIDMMIRIFIGVLMFSRSHGRYSIDAFIWRKLGRPIDPIGPAWPRYLLMFQLVWIYFSGGINKSGAEWGPHGGFLALANTLADPHFARWDNGWVELLTPLTRIATAVTIIFEDTAPIYLFLYFWAARPDKPGRVRRFANRYRVRWIWMIIGAQFHLGIAIFMRLGIFPFGMLVIYPALLLPMEVQWLRKKLGAKDTDEMLRRSRPVPIGTPGLEPEPPPPPAEKAAEASDAIEATKAVEASEQPGDDAKPADQAD